MFKISSQLFENFTAALCFLLNDPNHDIDQFKLALKQLFEAFPSFIDLKEGGFLGNDDLVHSAIDYVASKIKTTHRFGTEVGHHKKCSAGIMLFNDDEKIGMIIELTFDDSAEEALKQIHKYFDIFKGHKAIKYIKSLGINISPYKRIDIETKLENNPNYSDSQTA